MREAPSIFSSRSFESIKWLIVALDAFNTVIDDYPQSPYRKKSLLKRGLVLYRKGDFQPAIESFKLVVSDYGVDSESNEAIATLKNIYLDTDWGQLDCLGEVLGLGDFEEVRQQSEPIELDGFECQILRIDALIIAKKAMGRPKDIETIKQLEVIKQHGQQ